jgi:hypothetical protein
MKVKPYHFLHEQNIPIGISYFSVGFVTGFLSTPLSIYMIQKLNVDPQIQNVISILQYFPWALKIFFGFASDTFPIYGMHRIPYLLLGAFIYSTTFFLYGLWGQHSLGGLIAVIFLGVSGLVQLDVNLDALCVERSRLEPETRRGEFQSSCYATRFGGTLVGEVLGALLSGDYLFGKPFSFFQISMIMGIVPMVCNLTFLYR